MADASVKRFPIKRALISVYDKTGIVEFCRALHDEFGIELISTGGTAKTLREAGLPVTLVEELTGFPEMLDGRVKTLHPAIHAGILADRDNPEHMRQLAAAGIKPIDMVVVNLYPFEKTVADPNCTFEQAIEMIDIGGVALLRAAAKNFKHVWVISEIRLQREYLALARGIRDEPEISDGDTEFFESLRRTFASVAFRNTQAYDRAIERFFCKQLCDETNETFVELDGSLPTVRTPFLRLIQQVRYGENSTQVAGVYAAGTTHKLTLVPRARFIPTERDVSDLSYNNYLDADAALGLCGELTRAKVGSANLWFASRFADLRSASETHAGGQQQSGTGDVHSPPADENARTIAAEKLTRRNLPHWQIPGATYWLTFSSHVGVLSDDERTITLDSLRFWDGKRLDLHAAVVMPTHVHALLTPRPAAPGGDPYDLSVLLKSIKGFCGREISQRRGGNLQIWDIESFDRWIREPDDFEEKWRYIANNPVKEGLAATPGEYAWWYGIDYFDLGIGVRVGDATPIPPVLGGGGDPARVAQNERANPGGEHIVARQIAKQNFAVRAAEQSATLPDAKQSFAIRDANRRFALPGCRTHDRLETDSTCSEPIRACVFIKHSNPCGASVGADPIEAYKHAYLADPNAAMGGILAVNFEVKPDFAEAVMESLANWGKAAGAGAFFVEVWVAPAFSDDAVKMIRAKKKWGENVRLLAVGDMSAPLDPSELQYRSIAGGMLIQTPDLLGLNEDQWKVVTQKAPREAEMDDLRLAWLICKHTKSNAISIVSGGMLIGNGAGQMSRVMSCRIATWLAKENGHAAKLAGSVAASDAFFPFPDGPQILIDAGVTALIQPGGSKRDEETIKLCNERGIAMIFTGTRHFRH